MFSYRHIYHAGNFADVTKHLILTQLLQALQRKETPFCVLDSHAGIGRYDLHSEQAQQTGEYLEGIARLWECGEAPATVGAYLDAVRSLNPASGLRFYPGSPRIARHFMRPQDRLILSELNKYDHQTLKDEFRGDRQTAVHLQDAYSGLKAFLPPKERRGLVLIDPTFELKDEYQRLVRGLAEAYKKWPTGIYAIWYPIMSRGMVSRFHNDIKETGIKKILCAELTIRPDRDRHRMNGSGMLIINPPWQLDEQLRQLLPWLWQQLQTESPSGTTVEWLAPE